MRDHDPVSHELLRLRLLMLTLPEQTFDSLEKPEYYFDAYHLNAEGRFTETLVTEVVGRLGAANRHTFAHFWRSNCSQRLVQCCLFISSFEQRNRR
jgi:hypothetical protein